MLSWWLQKLTSIKIRLYFRLFYHNFFIVIRCRFCQNILNYSSDLNLKIHGSWRFHDQKYRNEKKNWFPNLFALNERDGGYDNKKKAVNLCPVEGNDVESSEIMCRFLESHPTFLSLPFLWRKRERFFFLSFGVFVFSRQFQQKTIQTKAIIIYHRRPNYFFLREHSKAMNEMIWIYILTWNMYPMDTAKNTTISHSVRTIVVRIPSTLTGSTFGVDGCDVVVGTFPLPRVTCALFSAAIFVSIFCMFFSLFLF